MFISSVRGMKRYIKRHSYFSCRTINSVIFALGYQALHGTNDDFKELSAVFKNCTEHGASSGFTGFQLTKDTIPFFCQHRRDIVNHMERTAADCGMDIISFVQGFGVYRYTEKPTAVEVGKALWGNFKNSVEIDDLYNLFAWYALEEISYTWYRYLEDNPAYLEKLSA